jgi:hypothetical protein
MDSIFKEDNKNPMAKKGSFTDQIFSLIYKQWIDIDKTPILGLDLFEKMKPLFETLNVNILESKLAWIHFILGKNKVPSNYYADYLKTLNSGDYEIDEQKTISALKLLKNQPTHKQRSAEWFSFRNSGVTASAAYKILIGTPSEYNYIFNEKVIASNEFKIMSGRACLHGIMYEEVAQYIYEKKFKVKIEEYGCIQHKDKILSHILASPDGIVNTVETGGDPNMLGRMLEIKCPYTRVLNGFPIYSYFVQCQLQLEVCDLEFCDFYECMLKEYNETDFINEFGENIPEYFGVVVQYVNLDDEDKKTKYFYPENDEKYKSFQSRISIFVETLLLEKANIDKCIHWVLKQNVITTIKRDRKWFENAEKKLTTFWEKVLEKRKEIQKVISKGNSCEIANISQKKITNFFNEVTIKEEKPEKKKWMLLESEI